MERKSTPVILHDSDHNAVGISSNNLNCNTTPLLVEDGYSLYTRYIDNGSSTNLVTSNQDTWNIINSNDEPVYLRSMHIKFQVGAGTFRNDGWGSAIATPLSDGINISYTDRNGVLTSISPQLLNSNVDLIVCFEILLLKSLATGGLPTLSGAKVFKYPLKIDSGDIILQTYFGDEDFSTGAVSLIEIWIEYYAKSELA